MGWTADCPQFPFAHSSPPSEIALRSGGETVRYVPEPVRCKDCKHMFDWAYDQPLCRQWADGDPDDSDTRFPPVPLDGFCHMGEPREGAIR